jgi:two-component system sensor histidine kinase PilS (NtrC family)
MADGPLRRTLVGLISIRLVISTVLLGTAAFVQWQAAPEAQAWLLYALIGLTFVLSALYAAVLRASERRRWLIDVQLGMDALTVALFVWFTGGVTSYFSSLFVLPVIAASILQQRRGALLVGVLSSLLYALQVVWQFAHPGLPGWTVWTALPILPEPHVALYTVATNVAAFVAVAALSGSLAERVQRTDQELADASTEIASLQAFSQHIISSLTMGLVTTGTTGRILTFNRAAEAITGSRAEDAVGDQAAGILQLPEEFAASLEAQPDWPGNRRADYRYRRTDGTEIDLGLSATAFLAAGVRTGVLFTFQDVTQLRRLERGARMQQRLAAVGEMAAGIAHEIRNPLASISGSIQLLRQELHLSDDQARLLDIVMRESERLNQTISHFLAYARPERFSVTRLDARRPVNDAAMLLRNGPSLHPRHVIEAVVPDEPVWCEADEGQVSQVIWNLATNGLRAMPDGGRLRLSVHRGPQDGDAVLEVADEGTGMPEDELDRVFQPFHSTFEGGTGLGMAIVHRIVSDYGGEIHVTSRPGAGTTVNVRLPLRAPVTPA